MTVGPLVCALGLMLRLRIGPGAAYLTAVLPGVAVFGLGLAITVSPLTAAALAAGIGGDDYTVPAAFDAGSDRALWWAIIPTTG